MNSVCCAVDNSLYLLTTEGRELKVQVLDSESSSFRNYKTVPLQHTILSVSVCLFSGTLNLIVITTAGSVSFLWAPLFDSVHQLSFSSNTKCTYSLVKSSLFIACGSKYYISSLLQPRCDSIDVRGDALKVTVELGSISQLLPSDDDVIVDMISVAPTSSSLIIVLKNSKTGFIAVRWAELDKTLKIKWSMTFPMESLSIVSLPNQDAKGNPMAAFFSEKMLFFVNSTGVLSQSTLPSDGNTSSAILVSSNATAEYEFLLSCSDGTYYLVTVSISTKHVINCHPCRLLVPSIVPCCERMTLIHQSELSLMVYGHHSHFGYQMLNLAIDKSGGAVVYEVSEDIVWHQNTKLVAIDRLLSLPDMHYDSHLAVCQSSVIDQSVVYRMYRGYFLQVEASISLEEALPSASVLALPLHTMERTMLLFSDSVSRQSSMYLMSSDQDLFEVPTSSFVSDEPSLGLCDLSGSVYQITRSIVSCLWLSSDGNVVRGSQVAFNDLLQSVLKKEMPSCQYLSDSTTGETRPSSHREVASVFKLLSSVAIEHFCSVSSDLVLSWKSLLVVLSKNKIDSPVEVLVASGQVSCLTSGKYPADSHDLVCVAYWDSALVHIKSNCFSSSLLQTLCVVQLSQSVRQMILLVHNDQSYLICASNTTVSAVHIDINRSAKGVSCNVVGSWALTGVKSFLSVPKGVLMDTNTHRFILRTSSVGTFEINAIYGGQSISSCVCILGNKLGWLTCKEENICFDTGSIVCDLSPRVTKKMQLKGLVLDVVKCHDKVVLLHRRSDNVYCVSACLTSTLECFWSQCLDTSFNKQYRLITGPEPPTNRTGLKTLKQSCVFTLLAWDGVTPLADLTPGTHTMASSSATMLFTSCLLCQVEGSWSLQIIGGQSVGYQRFPEWKEDWVDLMASCGTLHSTAVGSAALAVVVPHSRLLVLGWTDNSTDRIKMTEKAQQSGRKMIPIPHQIVSLGILAESELEQQVSISDICSSNNKFIYVSMVNVGVDILMLSKSDALHYEGNGYTLQTVYKLRDVSVSIYSQLSACCEESTMFLTTSDTTQPTNKFRIALWGGASDPLIISVDVNGILRPSTESYDLNNDVLQVKPSIVCVKPTGNQSVKFAEVCAAGSYDRVESLFRFHDSCAEVVEVIVTESIE